MENPVIDEESCYNYGHAYGYAEGLAYPEFQVETVPKGFEEVEDLVEADEDEKASKGNPEVVKSHKGSLEVLKGCKVENDANGHNNETYDKHILPSNPQSKSSPPVLNRPNL